MRDHFSEVSSELVELLAEIVVFRDGLLFWNNDRITRLLLSAQL
jgi:hypothetical protein